MSAPVAMGTSKVNTLYILIFISLISITKTLDTSSKIHTKTYIQNNVYNIDKSTFNDFISSNNKQKLVYFYVNWSQSHNELNNMFQKAATELVGISLLGKIDAGNFQTQDIKYNSQYNIVKYPTFIIFKNDAFFEYLGNKDTISIVNQMKELVNDTTTHCLEKNNSTNHCSNCSVGYYPDYNTKYCQQNIQQCINYNKKSTCTNCSKGQVKGTGLLKHCSCQNTSKQCYNNDISNKAYQVKKIFFNESQSKVQKPSNIFVSFRLLWENTSAPLSSKQVPVDGLSPDDLDITAIQDGKTVKIDMCEWQLRLGCAYHHKQIITLLLDLSHSIIGRNRFPNLIKAVKSFIDNANLIKQKIAIIGFNGKQKIQCKWTNNYNWLINHCLKDLNRTTNGVPTNLPDDPFTTDLYGATNFATGLTQANIQTQTKYELRQGALFIFTDGLDTASLYSFKSVENAMTSSSLKFYIIFHGQVVFNPFTDLLKRFEIERIDNMNQLSDVITAFKEIQKKFRIQVNSYQFLFMCSPARAGIRTIKIALKNNQNQNNAQNSQVIKYDATGFQKGCYEEISKVCKPQQINPCIYINDTDKIQYKQNCGPIDLCINRKTERYNLVTANNEIGFIKNCLPGGKQNGTNNNLFVKARRLLKAYKKQLKIYASNDTEYIIEIMTIDQSKDLTTFNELSDYNKQNNGNFTYNLNDNMYYFFRLLPNKKSSCQLNGKCIVELQIQEPNDKIKTDNKIKNITYFNNNTNKTTQNNIIQNKTTQNKLTKNMHIINLENNLKNTKNNSILMKSFYNILYIIIGAVALILTVMIIYIIIINKKSQKIKNSQLKANSDTKKEPCDNNRLKSSPNKQKQIIQNDFKKHDNHSKSDKTKYKQYSNNELQNSEVIQNRLNKQQNINNDSGEYMDIYNEGLTIHNHNGCNF